MPKFKIVVNVKFQSQFDYIFAHFPSQYCIRKMLDTGYIQLEFGLRTKNVFNMYFVAKMLDIEVLIFTNIIIIIYCR